MRQVTLFYLFMIVLMLGAFAYFFPKQLVLSPLKVVMDNSSYETTNQTSIKKSQQLNMTTNAGFVQIHSQADELPQEQKRLMGIIDYDRLLVNNTDKEISDILKKANGKSYMDVLKLKILRMELLNDQQLLGAHGQQLIALNDQLNKNKQLLAGQRDLVNINTESSLQLLGQHNSLLKDQSAIFFDKVRHQSNDFLKRIQDLVEENRQKVKDQQR